MRQNSCSFLRSVAISLNLELESGYPKATPHLGGRTSPEGLQAAWRPITSSHSRAAWTTTQSKMPNHLPVHRNVQSFVNLRQNRANADAWRLHLAANHLWSASNRKPSALNPRFRGRADVCLRCFCRWCMFLNGWMACTGVVRVRILWLEHAPTVVWCNPHHQPIRGKLHSSQGCPRLPTSQCPNHTAQPAVIGFAASSPRDPRRFYHLHLGAWLGPRCRKLRNAEEE